MMSLVVEDCGVVDDDEANDGTTRRRRRRRRGIDGVGGRRVRGDGNDGERSSAPRAAAAVDDDGTKPTTVETTSGINASVAAGDLGRMRILLFYPMML